MAVFANYGLEAMSFEFDGIKHFPRGAEQYSNDVVPAQMHEHFLLSGRDKALLITLYDVWVFKGPQWDNWAVASWVPIDHAPCPPAVLEWCARPNVTPLAMSQFGQQQLANVDIDSIYIPHALEDVWRPTPLLTAGDGRQVTGFDLMGVDESRWVVMMNAANKGVYPSRKAFAEALVAFRMFVDKHDDAVLYLHTERHGGMGGIALDDLIKAVDLKPDNYRIVDQYAYRGPLASEFVAACYTSADVLLSCSKGEGFGLAVLEAQACGTPVIVSDFTAQPELVGDGWLVDGQPDWDPMQRSWWITPNIATMVEALEQAYRRGRGQSQKAIDFAEGYRADKVYAERWRPAIEMMT